MANEWLYHYSVILTKQLPNWLYPLVLIDNAKEFTVHLFSIKMSDTEKHEFARLCAELDIEH